MREEFMDLLADPVQAAKVFAGATVTAVLVISAIVIAVFGS
jgi:hypothetical protein